MQLGMRRRILGHLEQRLEDVYSLRQVERPTRGVGAIDVLFTTSSKLLIRPPPLNTSYSLGTWMSHRTLCDTSLLLMTHFASLSHSLGFLQGR